MTITKNEQSLIRTALFEKKYIYIFVSVDLLDTVTRYDKYNHKEILKLRWVGFPGKLTIKKVSEQHLLLYYIKFI